MPLPKNYYTWDEALTLVRKGLPDEAAADVIADSIQDGQLPAWFIDGEARKRIDIEPYRVRTSFDEQVAPEPGLIVLDEEGIWLDTLTGSAKLVVPSDILRDGGIRPDIYRGQVRVDKGALEGLLSTFGTRASQRKGGSKSAVNLDLQAAMDWVLGQKDIIRTVAGVNKWLVENAAYPDYVEPPVPNCNELQVSENGEKLAWKKRDGGGGEIALRSLARYTVRSIEKLQ